MQVKLILFILTCLGGAQQAIAAKQCLGLPGTYGAVTVSGCANDYAIGVINPASSLPGFTSTYPAYPYDGLALGGLPGNLTCTYNFSHSIATNSITIDLDFIHKNDLNANPPTQDSFTVEINGSAYAFSSSDIIKTPLIDGASPQVIAANLGRIQNAPETYNSSGTVQIGATAPIRTTTLKLSMDSGIGGGVTRVCLDDTAHLPKLVDDSKIISPTSSSSVSVLENDEAGVTLDSAYPLSLSSPATGTLTYSGNQIQFTPTSSFSDTVTYQYQACNTYGDCSLAKVTLIPQAVAPALSTASPVPLLRSWSLAAISFLLASFGIIFYRRNQNKMIS
ncbi:Ig-like domain-containing protein [Comamonas odontotermitis]|uniref:Ig-like domain-containing protein n=1 Tax=Comamonas odontotermitis TaxID=379895 RepID=UPI001CC74253|nr:Ig-like domain-containing protein [Comamonas odontotermitis]UBB15353.1 hypothetical protein LAD35_10715 [Comamonas odontotermitis]